MPHPTRRSVLAALGAALPTAGCLTGPGRESPDDSTTSASTTALPTSTTPPASTGTTTDPTSTDDSETTGDWISHASNEPDPDHSVTLNNESSETRIVRVWVTREETGETVFETTRESPPGTEYELYDLARADPDGIEAFAVCGELVGADATTDADGESSARDCVTLRTNACYGNAHVTIREDGSLQIIYSIC